MNPPSSVGLSVAELIQSQGEHPRHSLTKAAASQWFKSICEGLIQQQVSSILWATFSLESPLYPSIAAYGESGLLRQVYWCQTQEDQVNQTGINLGQGVTIKPLVLAGSSRFPDNFFVFLSAEISLLWLVETSTTPGMVNVIQSLCPTAIAAFLAGIKQAVAVTDDLPPDFFQPQPLPGSANLALVNRLIQGTPPPLAPPPVAPQTASPASPSTSFFLNAIRELGIPLTHMKTALRLLESLQHKREQRQRYLDLLKQECDRQNSLLTGLQELLQIDQTPMDRGGPESVRIEDCVPGVVSTYQPLAKEKGIALGYTIPGNFPAIACSAADLRTILQHLLHNSLKFTPQGGKVYVKAHRQEQTIDLVVSDSGCGIEMPDIPHLFDCFYRGRNGQTGEQGAGLGLTIVQRLVKRRGGTIRVNSHPGRGSYFYVNFPIDPGQIA
ncbi:MAG: HAMP domain-containing sensor histidine kinase [Synechocystis sp.]|nr:HAMP domain-containing sensor histidine kinase [Synechocystis sp.]